ncbi:unnamed protein product [Didymodactylos carnosus]|uniref:Delta-like protein n=1 Tax=Didymodactylos carnosus TaxID=1234261 RepID=A0A814KLN8_9BILA|nr:unnamed protein product [Didymodactylos carnosus]CAF1054228.1 unnamed protein product [Didymodactylos carnosus]CAF3511886.1 unnamed protein product [Didymodactylos carnosus]CAF3823430.1 unnamed protein product [Didymodactylos carnosus]
MLNLMKLTLLIMFIFVYKSFASGKFELQLTRFQNHDGLNSNGSCCSGPNLFFTCLQPCKTFIRLCLRYVNPTIDDINSRTIITKNSSNALLSPDSCTFGFHETPVLGGNNLYFTETSTGQPNIFQLPFNFSWMNDFVLQIDLFNDKTYDGITFPGSERELIFSKIMRSSLHVGSSWSESSSSDSFKHELEYNYRVECEQHFYGAQCSKHCRERNDDYGHYTCTKEGDRQCMQGWQGINCQKAVCSSGCSSENGYCTQPGECKCRAGWSGLDCNQCAVYPGCVNGYCTAPFTCVCHDGWTGPFCNNLLNTCASRPCLHNGQCTMIGSGAHKCTCTPYFTGEHCEISLLTSAAICENNLCQNQATCIQEHETYRCICTKGFKGVLCDEQEEQMQPKCPLYCQNGGVCTSSNNNFQCVCPYGYQGILCERESTLTVSGGCSKYQCYNGGTCLVKQGDNSKPTCSCIDGWQGADCREPIDYCQTSRPCRNGGICSSSPNKSFQCHCSSKYVGLYCEIDLTLIRPSNFRQNHFNLLPIILCIIPVPIILVAFSIIYYYYYRRKQRTTECEQKYYPNLNLDIEKSGTSQIWATNLLKSDIMEEKVCEKKNMNLTLTTQIFQKIPKLDSSYEPNLKLSYEKKELSSKTNYDIKLSPNDIASLV